MSLGLILNIEILFFKKYYLIINKGVIGQKVLLF